MDQADGRIDVGRVVVDLGHDQSGLRQRAGVEVRDDLADVLHDLDDVDAGVADDADNDRPLVPRQDLRVQAGVIERDVRDVGDADARDPAGFFVDRKSVVRERV